MISVLILTRNEEQDLPGCLASVAWSDDVHVFDSFSTDATVSIAEGLGAKVAQRVFDNYANHRNAAFGPKPLLDAEKFRHRSNRVRHDIPSTDAVLGDDSGAVRLDIAGIFPVFSWV